MLTRRTFLGGIGAAGIVGCRSLDERVARDYYFPAKIARSERPPLWDDIVRDNSGRHVAFHFNK